jgi:pyruvate dehydrogenase E2 component (dihydrolipoyllysine-residue acetyltransferase)
MAELVMPRLSDTMEEGTILRWLKADGDQVARGEELVEIETDKATMTYESDQAGVLQILAGEGETLAVGAPIARVGDGAEKRNDEPASGPAGGRAGGVSPPGGGSHPAEAPPGAEPAVVADDGERGLERSGAGRVKASPLARRIAGESGVELSAISGSGPGGRIVKADVLASSAGAAQSATALAASSPSSGTAGSAATPEVIARPGAVARPKAEPRPDAMATPEAVAAPEAVATAKGETETVELSRTQQTIARRMAESKATIPDFTLLIDVDMEECVGLRSELKRLSQPDASVEPGGGAQHDVPTYNDMVVKACALALREHPSANSSYRDGRLQMHSRINVGVAVAAQDALVVPTVFDAEEKSLGEIARETRALAGRVRDGTITPPELGGGTFTVSNLGMYGVRSFTAIINPPQAAIVSVGALEPRAVVREGDLVIRNSLTLTLACDHRILYGAQAALFLARIRELLESPSALTL